MVGSSRRMPATRDSSFDSVKRSSAKSAYWDVRLSQAGVMGRTRTNEPGAGLKGSTYVIGFAGVPGRSVLLLLV